MKIRIQNNSIRIRVNQEELQQLANGEYITMTTVLPTIDLCFEIYPSEGMKVESNGIKTMVHLPLHRLKELFNSNEEGFREIIKIDPVSELALLFQKDYVCIGRNETLNKGLFPNPKVKDGTC